MKQIFIILLLSVCFVAMAQKQTGKAKKQEKQLVKKEIIELVPEKDLIVPTYNRNACLGPPSGFTKIEIKGKLVSSIAPEIMKQDLIEDSALPGDDKQSRKKPEQSIDLSKVGNIRIASKKDYKKFACKIDLEVDWKTENLTFYSNSITYQYGSLDSDHVLKSVYISADGKTLCLGFHSTFYGICQGVAQRFESYSTSTDFFVITIPGTVEKITSYTCYFGPDCSDIP